MKKILVTFLVGIISYAGIAQNVGIGNSNPHPSAVLDITDTSRGILIPRMTMTQRNSIQNPAEGLMVYQTDSTKGFWYYSTNQWVAITSSVNLSNQIGFKRYFFNLKSWSTPPVAANDYFTYKGYDFKFASDSSIKLDSLNGEIIFKKSGLYKIELTANFCTNVIGVQHRYFSSINNTWTSLSGSLSIMPNYFNVGSAHFFQFSSLNVNVGDKIALILSGRYCNCGDPVSTCLGGGGLQIEQLN
jgi:hypothetical protein